MPFLPVLVTEVPSLLNLCRPKDTSSLEVLRAPGGPLMEAGERPAVLGPPLTFSEPLQPQNKKRSEKKSPRKRMLPPSGSRQTYSEDTSRGKCARKQPISWCVGCSSGPHTRNLLVPVYHEGSTFGSSWFLSTDLLADLRMIFIRLWSLNGPGEEEGEGEGGQGRVPGEALRFSGVQ